MTRERLRQIEAKALRKLRHPSRSEALRYDYLDNSDTRTQFEKLNVQDRLILKEYYKQGYSLTNKPSSDTIAGRSALQKMLQILSEKDKEIKEWSIWDLQGQITDIFYSIRPLGDAQIKGILEREKEKE